MSKFVLDEHIFTVAQKRGDNVPDLVRIRKTSLDCSDLIARAVARNPLPD
jgi:hypothetical protein